ncbi:MAG: sialidase family protein [Ktedonobacteraceae bacterium]
MPRISRYHPTASSYLILTILLLFVVSCNAGTTPTTHVTPTTSSAQATPTPHTTPTLTPTRAPEAQMTPLKLSSDPYSNGMGQYQTEVEPDTYAYGSTIVATFQAGRYRDIGSDNIGWATSRDGGSTWVNGFLQGTTKLVGGVYDRITDPVVTYDADHNTWMISSVARLIVSGNLTAPAVLVNLSTDGGITWNRPITVAYAGSSGILDKDWLVCDNTTTSPFYGHCYMEWDDFNRNDLIQMSTSIDGGHTWRVAKTTADRASGIGGLPLVQPGGKVIVPISRGNENAIMAFTSSDGGISWSSTIIITDVISYAKNAYYSGYIFLSAGIDGSGKVYLVWVDCRFEPLCRSNDLAMTTSTDGVQWAPIERLPLAPIPNDINYYVNGFGVDTSTSGSFAHLGLVFYYYSASCVNNCPLNVGFVSSTNGGSTWSKQTHLAGPMYDTWIAAGNNKVGDYIALCFSGGKAFPVFPVGSAPVGGRLNEPMYTVTGGLSV